MSIVFAENAEQRAMWDRLLTGHPGGTAYLLSWYLDHQRVPRCTADIVYFERDGRAVAGAVIYTFRLPAGHTVCLVPSGPIVEDGHEKCIPELVDAITERARRNGAMLLQFEAFEAEVRDMLRDRFDKKLMRDEPIWKLYHPTLWREVRVDLRDKDADSLLASFTTSTRQRVRQAEKKNVTFEEAESEEQFREIHELWTLGGEQKQYTIRPTESFVSLVRAMRENDAGTLLLARVEGKPAAFVHSIFHGGGSIYLSGAHDAELSGGVANRVLQYRAMCMAIERKIPWYSLGGPGTAGIREYKAGFRPYLVDNMRFVSLELKPLRLKLARPLIGQSGFIQQAKKLAARRMR